MQILESNYKNMISTTTFNLRGNNLGFEALMDQFFLKSIDLKVPNLIAPLSPPKQWHVDFLKLIF